MPRGRTAGALALAAAGLAAGGCGAGATTPASHPSASSTVGLGPVPTAAGSPTAPSAAAGSGAAPTASSAAAGRGAASAADGLSATHGYGTYELCQGRCTGAVPAALQRPLRLPAPDGGPCPVTVHPDGPLVPSTSTQVGFQSITGSAWPAAEVTWRAGPAYTGPVLIRGGEIGGGPLGFGEGRTPYDALELLDSGRVAPSVPGGGRAWVTYTRVRSSGCFAYQVDGSNFSEQIVFRAIT